MCSAVGLRPSIYGEALLYRNSLIDLIQLCRCCLIGGVAANNLEPTSEKQSFSTNRAAKPLPNQPMVLNHLTNSDLCFGNFLNCTDRGSERSTKINIIARRQRTLYGERERVL